MYQVDGYERLVANAGPYQASPCTGRAVLIKTASNPGSTDLTRPVHATAWQ